MLLWQQENLAYSARLWGNREKDSESRTPKYVRSKSFITDMEVKQLACSSQNPSTAVQKVENAAVDNAKNYHVKGKLALSGLGTPSIDYIVAYQEVFEHIWLYLILSNCLSTTDNGNLSKTSKLFNHFHIVLLHAEPNMSCKLFQHDSDYVSQTTMSI